MVICGKCGTDNPLGHLFCRRCGSRLDLSHMTSEAVSDVVRVNWLSVHWPKFLWLIVVALVAVLALACWPQTKPLGKKGTLLGGQRVSGELRALSAVVPGRTLSRTFAEEDLNGYFENLKARKLKVESFSVLTQPGHFRVRLIRRFGPIVVRQFKFSPPVSLELDCVPVGGVLRVRRVAVGHLTWLGPAKGYVVRHIHGVLAAEPEWTTLTAAEEIRAEAGKVWVSVRKE